MQTGAIEAVKQEKAVPEKGGRNYELDFFRLVFALLVFIYHTNPFIGKNTRVVLQPDLGAGARSEERRVGKECRSRWSPYH